uniref:Thrombomodulin n=1 Tax=Camelus bactrianus TaxID=9837 RepID=A0A9W3H4X1_CAMBA
QPGCNESAGESRCLCPAEAPLQADGPSCAEPAQHPCHQLCQQFCVPGPPDAPTNYTCMCATGYRLAADQHQCEDVDDCMQVPSPCPQNCVNEQGSFRCNCYPGYEQQDGECVELQDPCFGNKCEYECQPVGRSEHRCVCAEGFVPVPHDPNRCQMFCNRTSCPADCDPNNPESCRCPDGYILDESSMCTDIDECSSDLCSGECRNLPGSYECVCGPDSVLAGQIATDCDPVKVGGDRTEERTEDGGSGEPPGSPPPGGGWGGGLAGSGPSPSLTSPHKWAEMAVLERQPAERPCPHQGHRRRERYRRGAEDQSQEKAQMKEELEESVSRKLSN